eukprot:EG_transcript_45081
MKVVCKRVCDNIPMHIRTHLVSESIQTFGNQIIVQYTGSDSDKLEHLMEERPGVKAKREELQASLARLTRTLSAIQAVRTVRGFPSTQPCGHPSFASGLANLLKRLRCLSPASVGGMPAHVRSLAVATHSISRKQIMPFRIWN